MAKILPNSTIRTGIDLGGTKIEIIAMNESDEMIYQQRVDTPQGNYQATLSSIVKLLNDLEKSLDKQTTIGIGTPGAISQKTGRLKNSNSTCLNNQPLIRDLEKALDRPVRTSNDANCFVLSEASDGAAQGAKSVFGVIIGTGTGAGIVINGQIHEGVNRIAGEWGHNPLPWPNNDELPGRDCYCGLSGCIETFLSGPGLAADYLKHSGLQLNGEQIVSHAEKGDVASEACLQRYENRMARALAHVINILDPEVIVLGGGLSNIQRLYENVPKIWQDYVFSDQVFTQLLPPKFGDASGARGAARLWPL